MRRAVRERARRDGKVYCEVPDCPVCWFLELCHLTPHRFGGSREASNLVLLCPSHHALFDGG